MKWIKKIFNRNKDQMLGTVGGPKVQSMASERGMNFSIYDAVGGYVVEFSQYDNKTDRHTRRLHIITEGAELGTSIGHVITNEMLRR
jgi:hypothetical protein